MTVTPIRFHRLLFPENVVIFKVVDTRLLCALRKPFRCMKTDYWTSSPEFLIWLILGGAWEFVSLTSSQMMLILLVGDKLIENELFAGRRGNEIYIHKGVSYFAVGHSVLFWLYILNSNLLCSLFSEEAVPVSRWQISLLNFLWIFPGSTNYTSVVSAGTFCYFKDLLVFLRWFFLDARGCA